MQEVFEMNKREFYNHTSKGTGTYRVLKDGIQIGIDGSEIEKINISSLFVYFYLKNGSEFKLKRDRYFL
jgi:hypothetical protein